MNDSSVSDNQTDARIDSYYSSGRFFEHDAGGSHAAFKIDELRSLLERNRNQDLHLNRVADVGCGTGVTTILLQKMLIELGYAAQVAGYDIHPQMDTLPQDQGVTFHHEDFTTLDTPPFDLVVLFDVIEHIPDPISWLKLVAQRSRFIALHIPLDDSLIVALRNLWRDKLDYPGHLVCLDVPASLNLLAYAGLRTIDFHYTPGFKTSIDNASRLNKVLYPLRLIGWHLNPYILQKTLAGVSLMVLAKTPLEY